MLSSSMATRAAVAGVAALPKLGLEEIRLAAERLRATGARPTPMLRWDWLDDAVGCQCHLKSEHLQRTGSFKYRGATNAVASLDEAEASQGVVAHSSGNHGAALAAAAQARGVPCCVVVPRTCPESKIENMRRYGARVVLCEPTQRARSEGAAAEAERMGGATLVHPYDNPVVIAGQGTIGLELHEQLGADELDAVLVAVSGGGLISGIAIAIKALRPSVRVIAVEPEGKGLQRCLEAQTRVLDAQAADQPVDTIADAIRTRPLGAVPWSAASALLEPTVLSVSDAQIRAAMRLATLEGKQLLEPAGAVSLAALLSPEFRELRESAGLRHVAAVLCGGNIDPEALVELTAKQ